MSENLAIAADKTLYFEDIFVGQRFSSGSYVMSAQRIRAFAAEYDPQPFHLDDRAASSSLFRGLAASGWHTAAVTMRLNVESGLPIAEGIIGAAAEIAWPKPTRAGDTVHVESAVLELSPSRSRPDRGTATVLSRTLNQHGEVVQTLKAWLVIFRKPS